MLPDVFPVVSARAAAVPRPLPAVAEFVPQAIFRKEAAPLVVPLIEEMSLRVMSGWDIHVLPDVFAVVSAGEAAVHWPMPVVDESVPQVILRKEAAPVVVSLTEEMTLCVAMVGLIEDGSDLPIALLDPNLFHQTVVLLMLAYLSPVVSARGSFVLTSLPTISEVFSSAVLVGGGGSLLRQPP